LLEYLREEAKLFGLLKLYFQEKEFRIHCTYLAVYISTELLRVLVSDSKPVSRRLWSISFVTDISKTMVISIYY